MFIINRRPGRNSILPILKLLKKHRIIITRSVDKPGYLHIVYRMAHSINLSQQPVLD